MSDTEPTTYSPYTAIAAEGARIGLVTCDTCGCVVMLDPREAFSATERYIKANVDGGP